MRFMCLHFLPNTTQVLHLHPNFLGQSPGVPSLPGRTPKHLKDQSSPCPESLWGFGQVLPSFWSLSLPICRTGMTMGSGVKRCNVNKGLAQAQ